MRPPGRWWMSGLSWKRSRVSLSPPEPNAKQQDPQSGPHPTQVTVSKIHHSLRLLIICLQWTAGAPGGHSLRVWFHAGSIEPVPFLTATLPASPCSQEPQLSALWTTLRAGCWAGCHTKWKGPYLSWDWVAWGVDKWYTVPNHSVQLILFIIEFLREGSKQKV